MPKTAPDCARYSVIGSWSNGRPMNNVFEAQVIPDMVTDRALAVAEYGVILANAWETHICPIIANNYTAIRVDYVSLNSADGSTGSVTGTLPGTGGLVGASWSPGVARLVTKNLSTANRGQRKGKLFLGPAEEVDVSEDGVLNGPALTRDQNALNAFLAATTVTVPVGNISSASLVVIQWPSIAITPPVKRVTDPDGVGDLEHIGSLLIQPMVSSQRRRQRP